MGPFMFKKTVSVTFFTDCCAWNFFFTRESMSPLNGLFFFIQAHSGKPMFNPFVNILFCTHLTFICKFHMVCTSQPSNISSQTSVQAATIFNCLKIKYLWEIKKTFAINNSKFRFLGKKIVFYYFFFNFLYQLNNSLSLIYLRKYTYVLFLI